MDAEPTRPVRSWSGPWLPFTATGVAAYARTPTLRLLGVAALTALTVAVVMVYFVRSSWIPVIDLTIDRLPVAGGIRDGLLHWPVPELQPLANNGFLAVTVNPSDARLRDLSADVHLEIRATDLRLHSLLGYATVRYPTPLAIPLGRQEVDPAWLAWRPHAIAGLGMGLGLGIAMFWLLLAAVSALPVRLLAAFGHRQVTMAGSWRLGVAAWLPGTLPLMLAIVLYTHRLFSLAEILAVLALEVLLSLALLFVAIFRLPSQEPESPFDPPPAVEDPAPSNPFATGSSPSAVPPVPAGRSSRPAPPIADDDEPGSFNPS